MHGLRRISIRGQFQHTHARLKYLLSRSLGIKSFRVVTRGRNVKMLSGDRVSLCRLLSSLEVDDLSSDEQTFFEWARKSNSFAELSSAFGARRLLQLCAKVPQLEGEVLPPLVIELYRSFVASVNSLIMIPNMVDMRQLPLVLCAHFMKKQSTNHLVWITNDDHVHSTAHMAKNLLASNDWAIATPECPDEETLNRGEGSTPTLDIVTAATYAAMLRAGAPMGRVALLLVSFASHLLDETSRYYSDFLFIFKRYHDESLITRPKVALLYEKLDATSLPLSEVQPHLSKLVPQLTTAEVSAKELETLNLEAKRELKGYIYETNLAPAPAVSLLRELRQFLDNLLELYAKESELESHKGRYKMEAATKETPISELSRRAKYLDPLLPFMKHTLPLVLDTGSPNTDFIRCLQTIERNWENSPPKLILAAMLDASTALALLADVGLVEALRYVSKRTSKLLASVGKRSGKNLSLDSLFDALSSLQTFASDFTSKFVNTVDPDQDEHVAPKAHFGKSQLVLDLLRPSCEPIDPENALKEQFDASNSSQDDLTPAFDVQNWKARFIVHVSSGAISKCVKHLIQEQYPKTVVFRLGEASDDVTCEDFFAADASSPSVLISVPSSSKVLKTHYDAYCKLHPTTTGPKFIPGAQYGPFRNSQLCTPAPATHESFSSQLTQDSVVVIRLDTGNEHEALRELHTGPVGQIVVQQKTPSYSLLSRLNAFSTRIPEYISLVTSKKDIIEEATRTLDTVKSRQLKAWTPQAPQPTYSSPMYGNTSNSSASTGPPPVGFTGDVWPNPSNSGPQALSSPSWNDSTSTAVSKDVTTMGNTQPSQATGFNTSGVAVSNLSALISPPQLAGSESSMAIHESALNSALASLTLQSTAPLTGAKVDPIAAPTQPQTATQKTLSQQRSFLKELLGSDEAVLSTKMLPNYAKPSATFAAPPLPQSSEKAQTYLKSQQQLLASAASAPIYIPKDELEAPAATFAAPVTHAPSIYMPQQDTAYCQPTSHLSQGVNGQGAGKSLHPYPAPLASFDHEHDTVFAPSSVGSQYAYTQSPSTTFTGYGSTSSPSSTYDPTRSTHGYNPTISPSLSHAPSSRLTGSEFQTNTTPSQLQANSTTHPSPASSISPTNTSSSVTSSTSSTPSLSMSYKAPTPANYAMPTSNPSPNSLSPPPGLFPSNTPISQPHQASSLPPIATNTNTDPISLLHIHFSRQGTTDPVYEEVLCGGTDHARQYMSTCTLATGERFQGWGTRKKDAKKASAAYALEYVTGIPASHYFALTATAHTHRLGPLPTSFELSASGPTAPAPSLSSPSVNQRLSVNSPTGTLHSQQQGGAQTMQQTQASKPTLISKLTTLSPSPFTPTAPISLSSTVPRGPIMAHGATKDMSSGGIQPTSISSTTPKNQLPSNIPTYRPGSGMTMQPASTVGTNMNASASPSMSLSSPSPSYHNRNGMPYGSGNEAKSSMLPSSAHSLSQQHQQPYHLAPGGVHSPYDVTPATATLANPIGLVNEHHQKRGLRMPTYIDNGRTSGTDHEPNFSCTATLWDGRSFEARGSSKKDAKTNAALLIAHALGLTLNQ